MQILKMIKRVNNSWDKFLEDETSKEYFKHIEKFIDKERETTNIYPSDINIFAFMRETDISNIKVVLIGQDPYHNKGEAMGLSFSVPIGIKIPPSLKNIYKELNNEFSINIPLSGDLTKLAHEGMFLMNTILTVEEKKPLSHKDIGWNIFTDNVIKYIESIDRPIVYILLGNEAKAKKKLITNINHYIIEGVHPSPLSAYHGFFESNIFKRANEYLESKGIKPINYGVLNEN